MKHRCKTLVDVAYADDETFPGYDFKEFSPEDGDGCEKFDIDWTQCPRKPLQKIFDNKIIHLLQFCVTALVSMSVHLKMIYLS